MKIEAKLKRIRISAKKMRDVSRLLRGKPASEASALVKCICRKSARLIGNLLDSAIANAENNNNLTADRLIVDSVIVDEGPTYKRFRPVSRGSAHEIGRRTSNVRVVLSEIKEKK